MNINLDVCSNSSSRVLFGRVRFDAVKSHMSKIVEVAHTGMLHRILTRPSLLGEFISMDWTTGPGTIFDAKISIVLLLVLDFECPSFV